MIGLTTRQKQIESFIRTYEAKHGLGPSFRDIQAHLGCKSLNTVRTHLALLAKKGRIVRRPKVARAIKLSREAMGTPAPQPPASRSKNKVSPAAGVPYLGTIPAGPLEEAIISGGDVLPLEAGLFRGELVFALRVKGDSMKNAGILPGDYAILNSQDTVSDGQIAAVQENGEATLKRVYRKPNGLLLRPENPSLTDRLVSPTETDDVRIVGCLVGLLRIEGGRR